MTEYEVPRFAIVILDYLLPDDDALVGDLIEGGRNRSATWFWRQVTFAVLLRWAGRLWATARQRGTVEGVVVSGAMLVVLGAQAIAAASILNYAIVRIDVTRFASVPGGAESLAVAAIPFFVTALLVGRIARHCHRSSRIAAVLVFATGTTFAAFATLVLLNPSPMKPFLPSAVLQTVMAILFAIGLLAGVRATPRRA